MTTAAMVREFKEEAGLVVSLNRWEEKMKLLVLNSDGTGPRAAVHFFVTDLTDDEFSEAYTTDDLKEKGEQLLRIKVKDLFLHKLVSNVPWTLMLCRDKQVKPGLEVEEYSVLE